ASLPEKEGQVNVDESARDALLKLEKQNPRFIFVETTPFHSKRLYAFGADGSDRREYIGSFNVLSFHGNAARGTVREETMVRLDWDDEAEKQFREDFRSVMDCLEARLHNAEKRVEGRKEFGPRVVDLELRNEVEMAIKRIELLKAAEGSGFVWK
ncbi:MAG TPA: hypothetical protein VMW69_05945, partial [Spirochaetia bacterium]|nr:hypothetical protein [Spirochaetia bacterium]